MHCGTNSSGLIFFIFCGQASIFRTPVEITSQKLLDQSQAGVYMGKTPHTPPFGPICVPYPKGSNC